MWRFPCWYPHRLSNILLVFSGDWRLWSNANSSRIEECIYSSAKVLSLNSHLNHSNFDFLTLSIKFIWFAYHFAQVEFHSPRLPISTAMVNVKTHSRDTLKLISHEKIYCGKSWKWIYFSGFDLADLTTSNRLQVIVSLENTYWIDDVYAAWSAGRKKNILETFIFHHFLSFFLEIKSIWEVEINRINIYQCHCCRFVYLFIRSLLLLLLLN